MRIFYAALTLVFMTSCGSDKFKLPENASSLLTNDSTKTWKLAKRYNDGYRMNMGDCFLSYRVSYSKDGTTSDNNALNKDCGDSMEANWSFYTNEDGAYIKIKGEKVKALLNQEKDYKFFKISTLSDTLLVITFKHKQFGNKERTIEDYFVPEHINVQNRNYHN